MPERRLAAGKNTATQSPFLGATVRADFFESQHTGHDLIRTPLGAPFDEMLIWMPRAHHTDSPLPVMTCVASRAIFHTKDRHNRLARKRGLTKEYTRREYSNWK